MEKYELHKRVTDTILVTKEALQTVYDALNQGQRKKIVKNTKVKKLFDLYGVEYSE
jgi:hypothetical protein